MNKHAKYRRLALLLVLFAAAFLFPKTTSVTAISRPLSVDRENSFAPVPEPSGITSLPIVNEASKLNAGRADAGQDLAVLELLISQYRRHFDGNPVGDNVEISTALRGINPKRIAFLPDRGSFLDRDGRLVDRWGTPYFFHAIAADRMEIISAGPDREFWTGDDIAR